eukprot:3716995-Prorocentrum_lima.AAC.1
MFLDILRTEALVIGDGGERPDVDKVNNIGVVAVFLLVHYLSVLGVRVERAFDERVGLIRFGGSTP